MFWIKTIRYCIACAALAACAAAGAATNYPHTDPGNLGNWVLREDMSDEFTNGLDHAKWQVCAKDGVYWPGPFKGRIYNTAYTGGVPGGWQFSPDNIHVTNGLLKITTKYEPDYDWYQPGTDVWTHTTAGMWSKQTFVHGYMEVKCKSAPAFATSSFWTTGGGAELDVFESVGQGSRIYKMWSSIHDWQLGSQPNRSWTQTTDLPFSFPGGFHVYGAEVTADYVKIYADGQLVHSVTRDWVETTPAASTDLKESDRWPMIGDNHVWVDSEIFEWWGVPDPSSLPADYEVEYIRVWEKAPAFLWNQYVALYSLSGSKTNNTDADALNDWAEYVFNGNPTNPADVGAMPTFDATTGEYAYLLRNDALLTAHVLTKTNLHDASWSTNDTVDIAVNDGAMGTNTTILGTAGDRLFVKLLVEEVLPPPTYPPSKGNNVTYEWIANVTIGSLNRTSGKDGGYYDGTAISTSAAKGASVAVSLTPGFSSSTYNEYWRIWIDLNFDGDFTDPGEQVFSMGPSTTTATGSFTLPATYAYTGPTRMRVSMKYNGFPTSVETFNYGEVEDYTFIVQPAP